MEFFQDKERNYKNTLQTLEKENQFLRAEIKKIAKNVKNNCSC